MNDGNVIDLSILKPRNVFCEDMRHVSRRKVVVAMTSWPKRIEFVSDVILGFLNNTRSPDIVFLSLSTEEFPHGEEDLPENLLKLVKKSRGRVRLNWVDGPNTKPWKKVFPILQYLNDDDLIILADDDMIVQNTLVETRVREFDEQYGRFAIMGGGCYKNTHLNIPLVGNYKYNIICPTSIIQKRMLDGWDKIMCDELVQTYHDDFVYSMLCLKNGYRIIPSKILNVCRSKKVEKTFGMHEMGICKTNKEAFEVFNGKYEETFEHGFKQDLLNLVIWDSTFVAGDNGEYFYRTARELNPNLNMTFLLSKNSKDWDCLKEDGFNLYPLEGDQVEFILDNATWLLFSKQPSDAFDKSGKRVDLMLGKYKGKGIFLQHGVTSDISSPLWYFQKILVNISSYIITTSDKESETVKKYSDGKLIPLPFGFPRWDVLLRKQVDRRDTPRSNKRVFISFHWRSDALQKSETAFVKSDYLKGITSLLNCPGLKDLHDRGVEICFLPHSMFKKYERYFKIPSYVSVPSDVDFQDLLLESDVLVTDVSSNTFEMAYLGKPSLSWIPDAEHIKKHMWKQYHLDVIKNHGHIIQCTDVDDVVGKLNKILFSEVCSDNVTGVFKNHDMDNTKRLLDWIYKQV